tara:strand:- start:422 stop:1486 length:1065 start_codon:yes stop_codon:yes gene_type:complete
MTRLAAILRDHQAELFSLYGKHMQTVHHRAIKHILTCHTPACGEIHSQCEDCHQGIEQYPSCGNRFCPACQHRANGDWLSKQQQKLLPVDYYMVTFTLPRQLRALVWHHQTWAYQALFDSAVTTLQSFFARDKKLQGQAGLTGVLHTHARNLDFHPHVHLIVPAGSLNKQSKVWRCKKGHYLFNANNLAKVFRAKFIHALTQAAYHLPYATPTKWNADCQHVGKGDKALTYLARYLYRGVISEDNILSSDHQQVTFRYKDSKTKHDQTITEPAAQFLWRVIQHVLPKGFRRTRDYGFLHGNAKRTLGRIQLMLKVALTPLPKRQLTPKCCPHCQGKLHVIWCKHTRPLALIQRA